MTTEPTNSHTKNRKPSKSKKLSSAASNVSQAKAKAAIGGKIEGITRSRVERSENPATGKLTLTAIFPQKCGHCPHRLDLSFLLEFPNLQPMFEDAFLQWGANVSPRARIDRARSLRRDFFSYLKSEWSNMVSPLDIDDELLTGYMESIKSRTKLDASSLHPVTVKEKLCGLRSILAAVTTGTSALNAKRISEQVPSGPSGAHLQSEPIEVLGIETLLSILAAAEREVLTIENRFANAKILLAEGYKRLQDPEKIWSNTRGDYSDFPTCLAAVDKTCVGVNPLNVLSKASQNLRDAISHIHRLGVIDSYLYPSSRDLVPFALLIAVATVFNSETILSLRWKNIDFQKDQAGMPTIEIVGTKGRSARDLIRLLDPNAAASSQLSLKRLLLLLHEITARIRPFLIPSQADYLFVYAPKTSRKRPTAFCIGSETRAENKPCAAVWSSALGKFIKENNLPRFNLSQLRPTILDMVQFMDGSLEAASKVGNHRHPATTWTHYTSGAVRSRYRERIGQIILLRERWLQTGGAIDPRRLAPSQDKGAATPGFICLDPFDSPRPNQQRGKLCKDYGGCPACPLAAAIPSDPLCVAQYTALEIAIYRSQKSMNTKTWLVRWAPILADLASLLARIPSNVLAESRKISITLPNVG